MAKHVLILGFEPFGGDKVNPSGMVARSLEGRLIAGRAILVRVLPVETRTMRERIEKILLDESPDIAIALAQAGGRASIALERVAVNVVDFEGRDNVGVIRKGEAIERGGTDARLSNVPFERILEAWHANGVPAYISNSAGTGFGNQVLYELLALSESAISPMIVGMAHLPYLPAQAIAAGSETNPSFSYDLMKKAVELLIETIIPWVDQRGSDSGTPMVAEKRARALWIPRGVKEVER